MLVKDSGKTELRKQQDHILATRHMVADNARGQTRAESLHGKVTDLERQRGNALTTDQFMEKLHKINQDLFLEPHPYRQHKINADKACMYLRLPDGTKEFIIVCEADWMPEWSLMDTRVVRKPDWLPEGYWKPVKIPGPEIKRGWRTVLIRLIRSNLISLTDVERVFGVGNRETWKVLTGKGPGTLLI